MIFAFKFTARQVRKLNVVVLIQVINVPCSMKSNCKELHSLFKNFRCWNLKSGSPASAPILESLLSVYCQSLSFSCSTAV